MKIKPSNKIVDVSEDETYPNAYNDACADYEHWLPTKEELMSICEQVYNKECKRKEFIKDRFLLNLGKSLSKRLGLKENYTTDNSMSIRELVDMGNRLSKDGKDNE